jgi:hypothetical protein
MKAPLSAFLDFWEDLAEVSDDVSAKVGPGLSQSEQENWKPVKCYLRRADGKPGRAIAL